MKTFNAIILITIALVALGGACGSSNATVNTNTANTPSRTEATNSAKPASDPADRPATPVVAEKPPEKTTATPNLATPTAAYKAAYAARKNKDIEALRKLMTKDAIEFLSIVSGGKSSDEVLRQITETPQGATDESRNERIIDDKATLEYPDADGKWKVMYLAKEDGGWKVTMPKADTIEKFEPKKTK